MDSLDNIGLDVCSVCSWVVARPLVHTSSLLLLHRFIAWLGFEETGCCAIFVLQTYIPRSFAFPSHAAKQGSVYLTYHGSEDRMSLVPLHDEEHGVVISLRCFGNHGEHLFPENVEYCQSLWSRYGDYDYGTLMNTTFGLVPAGRSPGTFRLGEVMSSGAIPVFVGRDIVPAFRERFDWDSFSFSFTPDQVGTHIVKTLQAVPQAQLKEMQVSQGVFMFLLVDFSRTQ